MWVTAIEVEKESKQEHSNTYGDEHPVGKAAVTHWLTPYHSSLPSINDTIISLSALRPTSLLASLD
jgi:hypothetical protein